MSARQARFKTFHVASMVVVCNHVSAAAVNGKPVANASTTMFASTELSRFKPVVRIVVGVRKDCAFRGSGMSSPSAMTETYAWTKPSRQAFVASMTMGHEPDAVLVANGQALAHVSMKMCARMAQYSVMMLAVSINVELMADAARTVNGQKHAVTMLMCVWIISEMSAHAVEETKASRPGHVSKDNGTIGLTVMGRGFARMSKIHAVDQQLAISVTG